MPSIQDSPRERDLQRTYDIDVRPILSRYCVSCHSGNSPAGSFSIDTVTSIKQIRDQSVRWKKMREYVASSHMPPIGSKMPTQDERLRIVKFVEELLIGGRKLGDPGRVTLRRLNKSEYNNTVRDLLYLDATPADAFPSDDVGHGFDNIGDVLTISPLLMEGYILSAEKLVAQAIVIPTLKTTRIEASSLGEIKSTSITSDGDRNFYSNAKMTANHEFGFAGEYRIRVKAYGQQAGPEPCKMVLGLDGQLLETFLVTATNESPTIYEAAFKTKPGLHIISVSFVNDFYQPENPDPKKRDRNLVVQYIEIEGPLHRTQSLPQSHLRLVTSAPGTADDVSVSRKVISDFASRAYRRPIQKNELDKLVKLYQLVRTKGDSYERGLQVAFTAVLSSPSFVFHTELDSKSGVSGTETLGNYSLASRLSYFLWSSMPDDELRELASNGRLTDPIVLEKQVDRMLKDRKSRALADNFAEQWLNLRLLETLSPDPSVFPGWSDQIKSDMITETKTFFMDIVRRDGSVLDFLDSKHTFLNARLAKHYGVDGATTDQFVRVEIKDPARGGIITQGSVLTVTSNPNRTSPVKRGKWILDNILGGTPPPPPPDVGVIQDDVKAMNESSLRAKMEMHRSKPACAGCHSKMDPLGFSLDNFDGVGRWRVTDGKWKIDDSGILPDGTKFNGSIGLKKYLLAHKNDFTKVLVGKLLTYSLGRGVTFEDNKSIERIQQRCANNGYRFSEIIKGIVTSDTFRMRVKEE